MRSLSGVLGRSEPRCVFLQQLSCHLGHSLVMRLLGTIMMLMRHLVDLCGS